MCGPVQWNFSNIYHVLFYKLLEHYSELFLRSFQTLAAISVKMTLSPRLRSMEFNIQEMTMLFHRFHDANFYDGFPIEPSTKPVLFLALRAMDMKRLQEA